MQTEHVILLNAQGVPTGTLEKYAAHTAATRLHLAFSSWLFNAKGQLLVTRRALSKLGLWAPTTGRKQRRRSDPPLPL